MVRYFILVCQLSFKLLNSTVSQDSSLKIYNLTEKRQFRMLNLSLALSSCQLTANERTIVVGSWDNNMYSAYFI